MLYLQKYFTNFQKHFLWLKDEEDGYCVWKFLVHRYFGFAIATLQLFLNPENVRISISSLYTVHAEMLYLQKYLMNFQKLFLWLKDEECGYFGAENLLCTDILVLQYSNVTTFPKSRKCKNFNFSLYTVPARNVISSKVFNEFSKTFSSLKDEEGGYCGWKFLVDRDFGFAIATLQLSKIQKM